MDDIFSTRRSVRRFQDKEVEQQKITSILKAAQMAPTWGNMQCQELIVVRDREKIAKLAGLLSEKNPATLCTGKATVVFAVCGNPLRSGFYKGVQVTRYDQWFLYDLGIVSQNICLKAWELGLGSVIVGSFDHEKAERLLEIPGEYKLVSLIPVGYPDHKPTPPKRRELDDFVHYDTFSGK
ncbi:nitroreductase family protein [Desulforhopalus singaporensis]|uniref:Nitroreductase n=1 Tax=Desulforhopalus singaporensis TaxID=91360 RepID=A0A1H0P1U4_9BACT|nr:nitroreductase family protein [Desulforhopalus singaporensis]SDO98944.1 Nitroreductase [Desulforhopalus singaporensis]